MLNPCLANVPNLYPWKTPEDVWFSTVLRCNKMEILARNWLNFIFTEFSKGLFIAGMS